MDPHTQETADAGQRVALGKAFKEFVSSTVSWSLGFTALNFVWKRVVNNIPLNERVGERIKDSLPLTVAISAAFSLWDGVKAYRGAQQAEQERADLVQENYVLRRQVALTSSALSQVVLQVANQQPQTEHKPVRFVIRVGEPKPEHQGTVEQSAQAQMQAPVQIG